MSDERDSNRRLAASVAEGSGRIGPLVLELWQRTRMDWGFVTDRLAQTFRRDKWLGAHERRFVGEVIYGLLRNLRRIDAALARGRAVNKAPRDLERVIALLVLEGWLAVDAARRAAPEIDWVAAAAIDDAIRAIRRPSERIALACSLPDWLADRLVADWGDRAEPLAGALNQRAPMTVRANLLVGTRSELVDELARAGIAAHPGQWSDTAVVVDTRTNLFGLDAFQRGALEVQDEGSQLLADLAIAKLTRERPFVVDLCAGAGGKSLAIAARLTNHGRILASDVDGNKLEELRRRARRAKVVNVQAVTIDDGQWPAALDAARGKADVVFVDAPCSGIGALRRNPEARWRLREPDIAEFARRQTAILTNAVHLLAPAGRLVYATCTLLAAENQRVAEAVSSAHRELSAVRADSLVTGELASEYLTVTPDRHGTDGFFAAVWSR